MPRKSKTQEAKTTPKKRSKKQAPTAEMPVVVATAKKPRATASKNTHGGARAGAGHPPGLKTGVNTTKRCVVLPLDVEELLLKKSADLHLTPGRVAARLLENALDENIPLATKRKGIPDPAEIKKARGSKKAAAREPVEIDVLPNGVTFIRSEFATERAKEIINAAKELNLTPGQYVAQLAVEAFSQF